MYISLFKLFKIGIGPSSSHTIGPINASRTFLSLLKTNKIHIQSIQIKLFGSLAYTGMGHGTDLGIIGGLLGYRPENIDINLIRNEYDKIKNNKSINLGINRYCY